LISHHLISIFYLLPSLSHFPITSSHFKKENLNLASFELIVSFTTSSSLFISILDDLDLGGDDSLGLVGDDGLIMVVE